MLEEKVAQTDMVHPCEVLLQMEYLINFRDDLCSRTRAAQWGVRNLYLRGFLHVHVAYRFFYGSMSYLESECPNCPPYPPVYTCIKRDASHDRSFGLLEETLAQTGMVHP